MMKHLTKIAVLLTLFLAFQTNAQEKEKKKPFTLSGDMGIWYEGYGLDKDPSSSTSGINLEFVSKFTFTTLVYYFVTRFFYFSYRFIINTYHSFYQHLSYVC